jgi:hypothetical protein
MKDRILPKWEHPQNKNGGCLSYRINITDLDIIHSLFTNLCIKYISNTITEDKLSEYLNGLSFIVKKKHIIVKLWFKKMNKVMKLTDSFQELIGNKNFEKGIRQEHRSNIKRDYRKNTVYRYVKR